MRTFIAIAAAAAVTTLVLAAEQTTNIAPPATSTNAAPAAAAHKPDDVVARVNGQTITRGELDKASNALVKQFAQSRRPVPDSQLPLLQYDVLQQMVTHQLVLDEARGHDPADLDEQVKKQVDATKTQLGGDEAFNKALGEMGITPDEYSKRVREDLIVRERIRQLAESQAKVTPEEVKDFYESNRDKMKMPERVRASHILIHVPQDATEEVKKQKRTQIESIQTLLKSGEKFADLAKKHSEDPVSGREGGDLGYFGRGQMVPEFETVAFSLKTNEVSDIVTTKFGFHILKVSEHVPAGERSLADATPDIEKYLRYTKSQEITANHIKKLRENGKIEILIPKPEPVAMGTMPSMPASPAKKPVTVETKPVAAPKP